MLEESIITPATSDNDFVPKPTYNRHSKMAVKFDGNCKVSFGHKI